MASALIGPFKYIGAVYFPDEEPPPPPDPVYRLSAYVLWGIWKPETYGWHAIISDTINGVYYGESNVVMSESGVPADVDAPADVETGPYWDAAAGRYYYRIVAVTGRRPIWVEGDSFIFWQKPEPNNYFAGSVCTARGWNVTYRNYYSIFGIHHQIVESSSEFGIGFNFGGMTVTTTDGIVYSAIEYEPDGFGFLLMNRETT